MDLQDPDVLRVKRAHLNDLENVLPFLALCPLYLATGPSEWLAGALIRLFAAARVAHSVFYLNEVRGVGREDMVDQIVCEPLGSGGFQDLLA